MSETALPAPFVELPPTQAELPYDDGEPMESPRHKAQMDLLIDALIPWLSQREDGFVGGNMFVYYSLAQVRNKDFKGNGTDLTIRAAPQPPILGEPEFKVPQIWGI